MEPMLLHVDEAGRILNLGRSKVWQLVASGELETVQIGRSRRVPLAALEAFIERLRREPVLEAIEQEPKPARS